MQRNILLVAHQTIPSPTLRDFLTRHRDSARFTLIVPDAATALGSPELSDAIQELRSAGLIAEARFGDRDPLVAVADHWDPRVFDEVAVSTLAPASSRWMATALPRRIEKLTGALVTEIHSTAAFPRRELQRQAARYV